MQCLEKTKCVEAGKLECTPKSITFEKIQKLISMDSRCSIDITVLTMSGYM